MLKRYFPLAKSVLAILAILRLLDKVIVLKAGEMGVLCHIYNSNIYIFWSTNILMVKSILSILRFYILVFIQQ